MTSDIPIELRKRYINSFAEKKETLSTYLHAISQQQSEPELKALHLFAHKLMGSANSYGFNELGQAANDLLKLLEKKDQDIAKIRIQSEVILNLLNAPNLN